MSDAAANRKSAKSQLAGRFRAWWHGYEYASPAADAANDGASAAIGGDVSDSGHAAQDPAREAEAVLTDRLWGENLSAPGGADYAADMLSRLDSDASGTLLYAGLGAGGDVPGLQKLGLEVTGVEPDAFLANRAEESLTDVPVHNGQPEEVELNADGYDYAMVRELLCTREDEETAIGAISDALKETGKAAFNELAIDPDQPPGALDQWVAGEPNSVHLRTQDEIKSDLEKAGFTVVKIDDDSATHAQKITSSWAKLIESGDRDALARDEVIPLVREAERSARRVAALESGGLKMLCFRVSKSAEGVEGMSLDAPDSDTSAPSKPTEDNPGDGPAGSGMRIPPKKKRRRNIGIAASKDIPTGGWKKKG